MWQRLKGRLIVATALAVGIFFLLGIYADLGRVQTSLLSFRWSFLPLILGLAVINYLLRFFKWDFYLRALDVSIGTKESMAVFFAGLAMSLTPAKFGEVLKSFLVKQRCGAPVSLTAPIIFAERFTDFVALVVLSLIGLLSFRYARSGPLVGLISALIVFGVIWQRKMWEKAISLAGRIPRMSKLAEKMGTAYESTVHLLRPNRLFWAVGLSLPAWLAEGLGCYLVFRGMSLPTSPLGAVFIYSFSTLVGAITMLPGGLVGTEGSLVALAMMGGASKPQAVSSAFLIRGCTLWFAVILGIWVLVWHRKRWETTAILEPVREN
ncbi:MAG: YbhN family protein [bacterium]